jgi:hypothetical protein
VNLTSALVGHILPDLFHYVQTKQITFQRSKTEFNELMRFIWLIRFGWRRWFIGLLGFLEYFFQY